MRGPGELTSLDDVKVLGVNVTMLGEVEVLLCDENALCGDRVSAYPYMQQAAKIMWNCAIAMARVRSRILTSEEVPGGAELAMNSNQKERGQQEVEIKVDGFHAKVQSSIAAQH